MSDEGQPLRIFGPDLPAPQPEEGQVKHYEDGTREQRNEAVARYGSGMGAAFLALVRLHRLERKIKTLDKDDTWKEEEYAARKKRLQEAVAGWIKQCSKDDVHKLRVFSSELLKHDLSSTDNKVIENIGHKFGWW